jgi:hypothetical protein
MMSDREWWTRRTWVLALGLLLAAGGVSGQSLAEAAKREKERRAKSGPNGPAFTDEDLKQHGEAGASTSGDAGNSAGRPAGEGAGGDKSSAAGKSGTPKAPAGAGDEAYWRGRAKACRDAVAAAEARVAQAQASVDHTPAGIRQPLPGDAMKQVPRSTATDSDRRAAEANLEAAKAELARARKSLNDLEDEARRKGILPGWLR